AERFEKTAALFQRGDETWKVRDRAAVRRGQRVQFRPPLRRRDPEQGVRTEGRDHATVPLSALNRSVRVERIGRLVRRGKHFDVEPIEQRAWTKFRLRESVGDLVVDEISRT